MTAEITYQAILAVPGQLAPRVVDAICERIERRSRAALDIHVRQTIQELGADRARVQVFSRVSDNLPTFAIQEAFYAA